MSQVASEAMVFLHLSFQIKIRSFISCVCVTHIVARTACLMKLMATTKILAVKASIDLAHLPCKKSKLNRWYCSVITQIQWFVASSVLLAVKVGTLTWPTCLA
jgi:hypothetical protein